MPMPTTVKGFNDLWATIPRAHWIAADVSCSIRLPSGRILFLYGDTFREDWEVGFVHSSAIVLNTDGSVVVSHGADDARVQLLPDLTAKNRWGYETWYWIEGARVAPRRQVKVDGVLFDRVWVNASEIARTGPGAWDWRANRNGQRRQAVVDVGPAGGCYFRGWAQPWLAPLKINRTMTTYEVFDDGAYAYHYSYRAHPWARLASGKRLWTMCSNVEGVYRFRNADGTGGLDAQWYRPTFYEV